MPFHRCPRCWEAAYEVLKTHCYCVNCNYCPEFDPWFTRPISRRRQCGRRNKECIGRVSA